MMRSAGMHPLWLDHSDGQSVYFQPVRIQRVIEAAGLASGEFGEDIAQMLAREVLTHLPDGGHIRIERVEDQIEKVLLESGYHATARLCILFHSLCAAETRPATQHAMDVMNTFMAASR
ncbi:MAG: hypothetical protein KBG81_00970 [Moraxellaceae bacterium]|jgi:hypothetical protein|nr:hypothetical protein [Moraxellaceae bacterium]